MTEELNFYRPFERKLCGAGQGHVGKLIPCPLKTDAEFAAAANDHTDWSISLFGRGKNQGAGNDARSAGQRFVFDTALVGSHENFMDAAFLDKIHIRPSRHKHFVTPN